MSRYNVAPLSTNSTLFPWKSENYSTIFLGRCVQVASIRESLKKKSVQVLDVNIGQKLVQFNCAGVSPTGSSDAPTIVQ